MPLYVWLGGDPGPLMFVYVFATAWGHFNHANLNLDVTWMDGLIPTTENLAIAIWNRLEAGLPDVALVSVKLWETQRNVVEYRGS